MSTKRMRLAFLLGIAMLAAPAAAITVQVSSFTAFPYNIPQPVAQCIVVNLMILNNQRSPGFELNTAGAADDDDDDDEEDEEDSEGELQSILNDKTQATVQRVAAMNTPLQRFTFMANRAFTNPTNRSNFVTVAMNCNSNIRYRFQVSG